MSSVIGTRGYLVVNETVSAMALNDSAGEVKLLSRGGTLTDNITYNATQLNASWTTFPENTSLGRIPDGAGNWTLRMNSTYGTSNIGAVQVGILMGAGWNMFSLPVVT